MVDFRAIRQRYLEKGVMEIWLKDNAEVSLPVPCKNEGGELEEAFFIVKNKESEPYAWFKVESEYGKVRVYADRRDVDFHDGFVDGKTDCVTYNQDHYRRLIELYKSIREFAFKKELTREEKNKVIEYRRLFKTGTPQGLRRFYFSLGKEFFMWMNKQCEKI